MLPFSFTFKSGEPVSRQLLYAVKRALVTGQLRPGDRFPSVRTLSQEARINPNTAQKVVSLLVADKLLEVRAGQGTFVAEARAASRAEKQDLLGGELEAVVVEARKLGLDMDDVLAAVKKHWKELGRR